VGDDLESNGHFLLHKGWRGLGIEGNKEMADRLRILFQEPLEKGQLAARNAFITIDNINRLIGVEGKCQGEIDLLSIDIDGNDYWVWKAINCVRPRVVAIEYNAKFPPSHAWIMKYDEKHVWQGNDEHGASLKALELLGREMGYQLVGTNMTGVNAFFVKEALAKDVFPQPATAENLYNPARYKYISYSSGHPSQKYTGDAID
jgi:hypothetical protein